MYRLYGSLQNIKNKLSRSSCNIANKKNSKKTDQRIQAVVYYNEPMMMLEPAAQQRQSRFRKFRQALTRGRERSLSVSALSSSPFRRGDKNSDSSSTDDGDLIQGAPIAVFGTETDIETCNNSTDNLCLAVRRTADFSPILPRVTRYRRKGYEESDDDFTFHNARKAELLPPISSCTWHDDSACHSDCDNNEVRLHHHHCAGCRRMSLAKSTPALFQAPPEMENIDNSQLHVKEEPLVNGNYYQKSARTTASPDNKLVPNPLFNQHQEKTSKNYEDDSAVVIDEQTVEAPVRYPNSRDDDNNHQQSRRSNNNNNNNKAGACRYSQTFSTKWERDPNNSANNSFDSRVEEVVEKNKNEPIYANTAELFEENYVSRATVIFSPDQQQQNESNINNNSATNVGRATPIITNGLLPRVRVMSTTYEEVVRTPVHNHHYSQDSQQHQPLNKQLQTGDPCCQDIVITTQPASQANNQTAPAEEEDTTVSSVILANKASSPQGTNNTTRPALIDHHGGGGRQVINIKSSTGNWKSVSMQNLANRARLLSQQQQQKPSPQSSGADAMVDDISNSHSSAVRKQQETSKQQIQDQDNWNNNNNSSRDNNRKINATDDVSLFSTPQPRRAIRLSWSSLHPLLNDIDLEPEPALTHRSPTKTEASVAPVSVVSNQQADSKIPPHSPTTTTTPSLNIKAAAANDVTNNASSSSIIADSFSVQSSILVKASQRQQQNQNNNKQLAVTSTQPEEVEQQAMPSSTGTSTSSGASSTSSPFTSQRNSFTYARNSNQLYRIIDTGNNNNYYQQQQQQQQRRPPPPPQQQQQQQTRCVLSVPRNINPVCTCHKSANNNNNNSQYLLPWSTPLPLPLNKRDSITSTDSSSATSEGSSNVSNNSSSDALTTSSGNTGSSSMLIAPEENQKLPHIHQQQNAILQQQQPQQRQTFTITSTCTANNNNKSNNSSSNTNSSSQTTTTTRHQRRSRMSSQQLSSDDNNSQINGSSAASDGGSTSSTSSNLHCQQIILKQQQAVAADEVPLKVRSARVNVIKEIVRSERNFAANLNSALQTFVRPCERRPDLFDKSWTDRVFSQLEHIAEFSAAFLTKLETATRLSHGGDCYAAPIPHAFLQMFGGNISTSGELFYLSNANSSYGLDTYSAFCISEPLSELEFVSLTNTSDVHREFFEECRLQKNILPIPLQSFLIAPVQRICQYQLLLGELLKATPEDHPHRAETAAAATLMQRVATIINERRRQQESLERLALWQLAVDRWEGPNLLERSTRFIYSGALHQVKPNGRVAERDCFIFDHQLIFCKRTALRMLVFKDRIDLDNSRIVPLMDGPVNNGVANITGTTVLRNAWRIDVFADHVPEIVKSITFKARTKEDKAEWMMALLKERKLLSVSNVNTCGETVPLESRQLAWHYALKLFKEQTHPSYSHKRKTASISYESNQSSPFPSIFGMNRQQASAEASRRISAPLQPASLNVAFTPDTLSASLATAFAGGNPTTTRFNTRADKEQKHAVSSGSKRRSRSTIRAEDIVRVPGGGRLMINCVQTDV